MACWVVPSVAAELWSISIDQVMSCVHEGSLNCKREHGFTFVDVAPWTDAGEAMPEPKVSLSLADADHDDASVETISSRSSDRQSIRDLVGRTRVAPKAA